MKKIWMVVLSCFFCGLVQAQQKAVVLDNGINLKDIQQSLQQQQRHLLTTAALQRAFERLKLKSEILLINLANPGVSNVLSGLDISEPNMGGGSTEFLGTDEEVQAMLRQSMEEPESLPPPPVMMPEPVRKRFVPSLFRVVNGEALFRVDGKKVKARRGEVLPGNYKVERILWDGVILKDMDSNTSITVDVPWAT